MKDQDSNPHPPSEDERRDRSDRRRKPTPPLSRYSFKGRRRHFRRDEDRKYHIYVDLYGSKLLTAVLLLISLCVADAFLTLHHIKNGAYEMNPFMNMLLLKGDLTFFIIKYSLTALCIFLLVIYKNIPMVRRIFALLLILYTVIIIIHIQLFSIIPQ